MPWGVAETMVVVPYVLVPGVAAIRVDLAGAPLD